MERKSGCIGLSFCYAVGHCLLMLFAGTFTGFVEGFVKARGIVNFSLWAKRISGSVVALVGGWFAWRGSELLYPHSSEVINVHEDYQFAHLAASQP